eukprot:g33240.t1
MAELVVISCASCKKLIKVNAGGRAYSCPYCKAITETSAKAQVTSTRSSIELKQMMSIDNTRELDLFGGDLDPPAQSALDTVHVWVRGYGPNATSNTKVFKETLTDAAKKIQRDVKSNSVSEAGTGASGYSLLLERLLRDDEQLLGLELLVFDSATVTFQNKDLPEQHIRAGAMAVTNQRLLILSSVNSQRLNFVSPTTFLNQYMRHYLIEYDKADTAKFFPIPIANIRHVSYDIQSVSKGSLRADNSYSCCCGCWEDGNGDCASCCGPCCGYTRWYTSDGLTSRTTSHDIDLDLFWPPWNEKARLVISVVHSTPVSLINEFVKYFSTPTTHPLDNTPHQERYSRPPQSLVSSPDAAMLPMAQPVSTPTASSSWPSSSAQPMPTNMMPSPVNPAMAFPALTTVGLSTAELQATAPPKLQEMAESDTPGEGEPGPRAPSSQNLPVARLVSV